MGRMVDADALYERTAEWEAQALAEVEKHDPREDREEWLKWTYILNERTAFKHDVADAPIIDAVSVVRCKDCKHKVTTEDGEYNPHDIVCAYWDSDGLEETDFCSYGERRTDGYS